MALDVESRAKFNLKNASILIIETGNMAMDILVQVLSGFGAKDMQKVDKVVNAKAILSKVVFDLVLVGETLGSDDGIELVTWLRRDAPSNNKYVPVLMLSSHTAQSRVRLARDCGTHFIVAKPLTPVVILERILWVAREERPFVSCSSYAGPDRRFKFDGPPEGSSGRRADDLSAKIGDAVMPNMSQDQIDALLNAKKVNP